MNITNILGLSGVSIDTRTLMPGEAFIAIKGAQFDGHDFIDKAIEKGAALVIVDKTRPLPPLKQACPFLAVDDPIKALGELAKAHRLKFDIPVIGITGSNGKTTVKSMLGSIFAHCMSSLVTQGNLNNHLGVPLTLLKLTNEHQAAIIEMGANHPGDIQYLCDLAKPTITVVNNVMKAHLAGFKSLQGVAHSKGEIYQSLSKEGIAILNLDLEASFLSYFKKQIGNRAYLTYGLSASHKPDITAKQIQIKATSIHFTLITPQGEIPIHCPVSGHHNVLNALAASSLALAANVSLENIAQGLAHFSSVKGRLEWTQTPSGATFINDTYNANPDSFEAAIEVLALAPGIKILVMGDMGELGDNEAALHEHIGHYARKKGINQLLGVGPLSQSAARAFGAGAQGFTTKEALVSYVRPLLDSGVTCLFKGSRSAQMETVVQALGKTHPTLPHQTIEEC